MEDYLYLNIPEFKVMYKKWKKYGYTGNKEKENLKKELSRATGGYCMYCYSRIRVDNKWYGNLEHAIEKKISDKLTECIPNIGMACPVCNQSFKRIGEQKRKVTDAVRKKFEQNCNCARKERKQCTVPCRALRDLQKSYSELPDAEILLQPMGILGNQTKLPLLIRYDVLKMEFLPDTYLHKYSEEEQLFINKHIQRFRLNDSKYRTRALIDFIKNVIDCKGVLQEYEYNNLIVQLFADKLKEKTPKERVDICSKLYTIMFLKF